MTNPTIERTAVFKLLETGVRVPFRIDTEIVEAGHDPAEFGVRVELTLADPIQPHPAEPAAANEERSPEDEFPAEDTVEWGAFGFLFVLASLSFQDARPRATSAIEYQEHDEFTVADFIEHLRYRAGALQLDLDYVRGRRMKTTITARADGTVTVATHGRGKAAQLWLASLRGQRRLKAV